MEKLSTTIPIQTAVNPTPVQVVTVSDLKFDYQNIAGVNNLDDPAVKCLEEEEEERLNVCSCIVLSALNQLKPARERGAQVTGVPGSSMYTALCFPEHPEISEERCYSIKSILSSRWASKRKVEKELRKTST